MKVGNVVRAVCWKLRRELSFKKIVRAFYLLLGTRGRREEREGRKRREKEREEDKKKKVGNVVCRELCRRKLRCEPSFKSIRAF